jgi:putative ABC transport system permease protein
MGQGMRLVLAGSGLGLLGTFALTRTLQNQLFGVQPLNPISIAAGGCLLIAVSLLACYLPGRHATQIDPVVALRYE